MDSEAKKACICSVYILEFWSDWTGYPIEHPLSISATIYHTYTSSSDGLRLGLHFCHSVIEFGICFSLFYCAPNDTLTTYVDENSKQKTPFSITLW